MSSGLYSQLRPVISQLADDISSTNGRLDEQENDLEAQRSALFVETDITPTTFTNNRYINGTNSVNVGKDLYNADYKCTGFVDVSKYKKISVDVPYTTGTQPGLAFYATAETAGAIIGYLYKDADIDAEIGHGTVVYTVPENAVYVRASALKTQDTFSMKGDIPKADIIESDVEQLTDEVVSVRALAASATEKKYIHDLPFKALMPEFVSYFWCSNIAPSGLTNNPLVLTVSGTEGADHVTVSNVESPTGYNISSIDVWTGVVLTEDGTSYEVYNAIYDSDTASLRVYPKLSKTVTDATLASMYLDSGPTYAGLHLTQHGYKAWTERLYKQNPKHCEVGLYNASFNAGNAASISENPFVKIDATKTMMVSIRTETQGIDFLRRFQTKSVWAQFVPSYTPYEAKNGLYWEVPLSAKPGYLELLVSAHATTLELPSGQEIYVDVYIDSALVKREIITDTVGKRICVDYENATTGRVEVYSNKWAAVDDATYGFNIYKCTWWINEIDFGASAKLFPTGVVVAQEFDSWGVFHDGITGETLHDFINADAGFTVNYTNHSLGNQTTAWGLAYWYQNVMDEHPTIAITDFLLNDSNSVGNTGIPDTITGPDGKEYNNKITKEMYVANSKKLIAFAINNHIQPILMRNTQIRYVTFADALIDALSEME